MRRIRAHVLGMCAVLGDNCKEYMRPWVNVWAWCAAGAKVEGPLIAYECGPLKLLKT